MTITRLLILPRSNRSILNQNIQSPTTLFLKSRNKRRNRGERLKIKRPKFDSLTSRRLRNIYQRDSEANYQRRSGSIPSTAASAVLGVRQARINRPGFIEAK